MDPPSTSDLRRWGALLTRSAALDGESERAESILLPYAVQTRAIKGHEFGLKLTPEDKRALIAFLKTL